MTLKHVENKITWNQMAKLLGVKTPEDKSEEVYENVISGDFGWLHKEVREDLTREYEGEDSPTEDEIDQEMANREEIIIQDECAEADIEYRRAIRYVMEKLCNAHDLCLIDNEDGESFFVEPAEGDWKNAASKIIQTINGVGYFEFDSIETFIDCGPYEDAEQAVLSHLHWIAEWPNVYEGTKAKSMVERQLR